MTVLGKADKRDSWRDLWVRLLLYPGHTLPTAIAPVLIGAGLAVKDGRFAPVPLLLAFVGSWLIHTAGVFTDNFTLLRRHSAIREHPELLDAVEQGRLRLPVLRWCAAGLFIAGMLCGLPLLVGGGWPVVVLGVVGVVSAWGYAGRPLAYAARGLADIVFFVMFAVVAPLGTYYIQAAWHQAQAGPWWAAPVAPPALAWFAGVSVGALVVAVLVIDDIRDRHFDARKGWRTPAVRFGLSFSRAEFVTLALIASLWPPVLWLVLDLGPWVLLAWLLLPETLAVVRAVLRHDTTAELIAYTPRTARLSALHAALLAVGIALSGQAQASGLTNVHGVPRQVQAAGPRHSAQVNAHLRK
ncbi:MAG: UbiA family prenyltransferase [Pseudomonadota bacterium]